MASGITAPQKMAEAALGAADGGSLAFIGKRLKKSARGIQKRKTMNPLRSWGSIRDV